ncbi:unnamed protein product, partial [Timema podura]|nr:unnamed protein product [Timema podura]
YQRHCDSVTLGVRVVDLLDILVGADYSLNVTYDPRAGTCHVVGVYELCNARFLTFPSHVINKEMAAARLTAEEIHSLAANYVTTVRFNNRLLLREEQYQRECTLSRFYQTSPGNHDISPSSRAKSNLCRPP